MGNLGWCMPLLVSLLLCCTLALELEDRSKKQCKNPKGKLGQVKNLGCKSAVCSQGQGGKTIWKECQQPATEEKQLQMIEIQNKTKDKVDQINNKQTRVLERQDKMIEIQNVTQEKADQINNKQTRVIERQDKMIENQNVIISLLRGICGLNCIAFRSAEEFVINKNKKLGEINLGRQYIITFKLYLTAASPTYHRSIIHLTTGENREVYGDRTPALLVYGGTKLQLCSAIDGDKDYCFERPAISLSTWHSFEISQLDNGSEIVFSMKVNGETVVSKTNSDARAFPNVFIYGGNKWYETAHGKMKDLAIRTTA